MIKPDTSENPAKIAYLGIGSNLGNKVLNIETAKHKLQKSNLNIVKCSSKYETHSWPDSSKPRFINIVIKIKTMLKPHELLRVCNSVEKELGRKRLKKNDPRTCDIDILDYNQKVLNLKRITFLNLPHSEMSKRSFVLLPLFEISKSWKHPKTKVNIVKLINSLPIDDLRSIKQI